MICNIAFFKKGYDIILPTKMMFYTPLPFCPTDPFVHFHFSLFIVVGMSLGLAASVDFGSLKLLETVYGNHITSRFNTISVYVVLSDFVFSKNN